eukprot:COSAG01_NODE_8946_length_2607_cov_1.784290_1_plen_653_part_00
MLPHPSPLGTAAWCRVGPVNSGYSLAWPAVGDVEPSPDRWQLVAPAEVLNHSAVRCTPPPTAVAGPGLLSITLNGGANWSAGVPIMYYELVHASLDRRPYIHEVTARLMLGSDRQQLSGATLRVSVLLLAARASWTFAAVPGGADIMLPLPLGGLPAAIHNDMKVIVTIPSGRNLTLWTRMIRTPPPSAASDVTAVQVDMASGGGLLLNGAKWNAVGWYMAMSKPGSPAIPDLANLSAHMQSMARSGVNFAYVYGLSRSNITDQRWLFDQAEAAGVMLLLQLPGFQAVPPVTDAEPSDPCGLWQNTPSYSFRAELERVVTHARSHPAVLGYFLCDDCIGNRWQQEVTWPRNYRCVSSLSQVYNLVKALDPLHVLAGALDSGSWGWWFGETPSLLAPSKEVLSAVDLGRATVTIGGKVLPAQPTTQLSLDLFLYENYYSDLRAHASVASSASDWDRDGSLVQGLRHSAVVNSVGLWFPPSEPSPPTYPSVAAFRSVMWLGVLTAGMTHQLGFVFGEYCEASGCHADMTDQLGRWSAQELAPVLPAIRREFADRSSVAQASVRGAGDDLRARAWGNPAANGGGIYVVLVNLRAAPSAVTVTVEAPELEHGAWVAVRMVEGKPSGNSTVVRGELRAAIDASASNVYLLTREDGMR